MVVEVVYINGIRRKICKVASLNLLLDGIYDFISYDKRFKEKVREVLISKEEVKAFYAR